MILLDLQLACKFELTTSLLVVKFKWRLAETANSSYGCFFFFFSPLLLRNEFFFFFFFLRCIKLEYAHGTPQCRDENGSAGPWMEPEKIFGHGFKRSSIDVVVSPPHE